MPVRVIVLRAPGTNCDLETAFAFEQCGAVVERLHLFRLLEQPGRLNVFQILCIPGGFSYGDDAGAGAIFGSQLRGHLAGVLHDFLNADKLLLGICNGFQVLMRAGILPGGGTAWPPESDSAPSATLTWNDNGKFIARWVHLVTTGSPNVFLRGIEQLDLPIAHAEGRIAVRDPAVLDAWRASRQIALCYGRTGKTDSNGSSAGPPDSVPLTFPDNPNGSAANIAGLSDPTGRVLGLMPHPERHIHATQHPHWTRRKPSSGPQDNTADGLRLFQNAVAYFA